MEREELKSPSKARDYNSLTQAIQLARQLPVTDPNYLIFYYLIDGLNEKIERIKALESRVALLESQNPFNRP